MEFAQWLALGIFAVTIIAVVSNVIDSTLAGLLGVAVMIWAGVMTDEDAFLAVLRELGPVLRDGGVEIELAAIGEHEHAQGRHRLGAGVDVDDRIFFPGSAVGRGETGPEIDNELTIDGHGDAGAEFAASVEVSGEGGAHRLKGGAACAVDLHDDLLCAEQD